MNARADYEEPCDVTGLGCEWQYPSDNSWRIDLGVKCRRCGRFRDWTKLEWTHSPSRESELRSLIGKLAGTLLLWESPETTGGWCTYCQAKLRHGEPHTNMCKWTARQEALAAAYEVLRS